MKKNVGSVDKIIPYQSQIFVTLCFSTILYVTTNIIKGF